MSIVKAKVPPRGAEEVTEDTAFEHQWKLIASWKPVKDVWALRFGNLVLFNAGLFSGFAINEHYRRKLKLARYGFFSSYASLVAWPALTTYLFHQMLVTRDIVLYKYDCPVCVETKSVALQCFFGVANPLILAPILNYMFSTRYDVARIPHLTTEPRKLWEFHKNVSSKLYKKVPLILAANIIASSVVTYFEIDNMSNLLQKLHQIETLLNEKGIRFD